MTDDETKTNANAPAKSGDRGPKETDHHPEAQATNSAEAEAGTHTEAPKSGAGADPEKGSNASLAERELAVREREAENQNLAVRRENALAKKQLDAQQYEMIQQQIRDGLIGGNFLPLPHEMLEKQALAIAAAGPMAGKPFRERPGYAYGVAHQAAVWGLDPFYVSRMAYIVSSAKNPEPTIAYEAQLLNSVILSSDVLAKRPRYQYNGEGKDRRCIIKFVLKGEEDDPIEYTGAKVGQITTKNSPLWQSHPDQQLAYHTLRAAARLYFPDVLGGAYSKDEMLDNGFRDASEPRKNIMTELAAGNDKSVLEIEYVSADQADEPEATSAPELPVESQEPEMAPQVEESAEASPDADLRPDEASEAFEEAEVVAEEEDEVAEAIQEWAEYLQEEDDPKAILAVVTQEISDGAEWRNALTDEQRKGVERMTQERIETLREKK